MIKKMLINFSFTVWFLASPLLTKPFIIMLDPAALQPNAEECSRCSEILKKEIEKTIENTKVILSHLPDQEPAWLQCASFANWAEANLFIRIDIYQNKGPKPCLNVYHLVLDPVLDFLPRQQTSAQFIPLQSAHQLSIETSKMVAQQIVSFLGQPNFVQTVHVKGPYGIPFKPLIGVTAPAVGFEFTVGQWKNIIPGLVLSLKDVIENHLMQKQ